MLEVPVSVIIPCFNSEKTIIKSLESVKAQSVKVLEIVCIDDCSEDNTVECIRKYSQQNPQLNFQILINEVNRGPGYSRNLGWDKANGKYIAFLDADDVWHPEKIAIQYYWMTNNSQVSMSGHYCNFVDVINDVSPIDLDNKINTYKVKEILFFNPFVTPSVMLKSSLPYRFKSNKRYCEDHLLSPNPSQTAAVDQESRYLRTRRPSRAAGELVSNLYSRGTSRWIPVERTGVKARRGAKHRSPSRPTETAANTDS